MMATRRGRAIVTGGLVGALALGLSACGGSTARGRAESTTRAKNSTVSIVASTDVYGDIARQIAGRDAAITSIISDPAQDPHSYEASTVTRLELSRANLVIENGGGYDDFVDSMLASNHGRPAELIDVVKLSGKVPGPEGQLNEHVWYDFPTVVKLAQTLATALGRLEPVHASEFSAKAASFEKQVEALERQEASIRAAHAGQGVAITEPVPLYLLQASGLVNQTPPAFSEAVEDGTDGSAAVLEQTLKLFSSGRVKALVYNQQTSGPQTEAVLKAARSAKVAVVPVTETLPAGQDYLSWMRGNLGALSAALSSNPTPRRG